MATTVDFVENADSSASWETLVLPPPTDLYTVYVQVAPIEKCLALFRQAEEDATDASKTKKALATQRLYVEVVSDALVTSQMEQTRVAALRSYLRGHAQTIFNRLQGPVEMLEDVGGQFALLILCLCHSSVANGSIEFLEEKLIPFLLRMEDMHFAAAATDVVKAMLGWMSGLHIREPTEFSDANDILKASLSRIISHLASLDGSSSQLLPDDPAAHIIRSTLPPRPIVLLGPSLLSLYRNAKYVDADLAEGLLRGISDEFQHSNNEIQSFSTGSVPLWLALQQKGWSLWQGPVKPSSQKIMWYLPLLIGKMPDAIADAMKELGVTHSGCGTLQCNQGVMKAVSLEISKKYETICRGWLRLRSHILIFLSAFPHDVRHQLLGLAKDQLFDRLFLPPPSSHIAGANCPRAQDADLGPSRSQIDSDPAEDMMGGFASREPLSQGLVQQVQTGNDSLPPSPSYLNDSFGPVTTHAPGLYTSQPAFSLPGVLAGAADADQHEEEQSSPLQQTPTRSIRPTRPLPSNSRRQVNASSPLIDLRSPSAPRSTGLDENEDIAALDFGPSTHGDYQDSGEVRHAPTDSDSTTPKSTLAKRLFKSSPGSTIPFFSKRSRNVSPNASTQGILSASSSSSYGFGHATVSPSEARSRATRTPAATSNVSGSMPPDSVYRTSSNAPDTEAMEITPPRRPLEENASSSDAPDHDTPTRQTNTLRVPLGVRASTPGPSIAQPLSSPDPVPIQRAQSEAPSLPTTSDAVTRTSKLKDFKAALGARLPSRFVPGGSRGVGGSGRAVSDQTSTTRLGQIQEADSTSAGPSATLSAAAETRTRTASLGSSLASILKRNGSERRVDQ
ncbi:hypothetical protein SISNIDRAFT_488259 [Sistotremastrum niveocremeum HHB9708]|uniref:Uncharacterized protein n=1 Tax=Sistotremastrum niveocremeum HHB9708 TaxID=1314777 RepID=A0A164RMD0_9AGAM|nr:hypothetical protein SISNIDRAFT_488259 [Sistotremastrum niveocremeum HHB9708]